MRNKADRKRFVISGEPTERKCPFHKDEDCIPEYEHTDGWVCLKCNPNYLTYSEENIQQAVLELDVVKGLCDQLAAAETEAKEKAALNKQWQELVYSCHAAIAEAGYLEHQNDILTRTKFILGLLAGAEGELARLHKERAHAHFDVEQFYEDDPEIDEESKMNDRPSSSDISKTKPRNSDASVDPDALLRECRFNSAWILNGACDHVYVDNAENMAKAFKQLDRWLSTGGEFPSYWTDVNPKKFTSFVALCRDGLATPNQIDDYIDEWHEGGTEKALYEFLGMTRTEYARFVKDHGSLREIIYGEQIKEQMDG